MIILITGASHTGKTLLAQRLLEKYHFLCLSIDHLKMGLIRSGQSSLTPEDDEALTDYLWPIVREIIKTAVENQQNLIVEGCYVPADWRRELDAKYLSEIRFICLAMTDKYIDTNYAKIMAHSCDVEQRLDGFRLPPDSLKEDNRAFIQGFREAGEAILLIDSDYNTQLQSYIDAFGC
ncbi:MAG: AAA family ATPase [Oscillospiraceae bacterium]|nr:AAA family ATPase [Oscillospiraceae bacterium]